MKHCDCRPGDERLCHWCQRLLIRSQGGLERPPPRLEKCVQDDLAQAAKRCGWLYYHTWNAQHSADGFPDSLLVRPTGGTLLVLELKRIGKRPTAAQEKWLQAFRLVTDVFVDVLTDDGLQTILERLARR